MERLPFCPLERGVGVVAPDPLGWSLPLLFIVILVKCSVAQNQLGRQAICNFNGLCYANSSWPLLEYALCPL